MLQIQAERCCAKTDPAILTFYSFVSSWTSSCHFFPQSVQSAPVSFLVCRILVFGQVGTQGVSMQLQTQQTPKFQYNDLQFYISYQETLGTVAA